MPNSGVGVTAKVELTGNFFVRDPGRTLRGNVRRMVESLAVELEKDVADEVASHAGSMPFYTGWTHDHIRGRAESVSGKQWGAWAVVSAFTADLGAEQAIRTKAAAATIERRWHPWRKVKQAVYRARTVISADLTEGMN